MNSTWFYGIPFAFNQFNILIPFPSPPLLLQLRQLKNPPNSLLHVQITLRLAEKKGQTHTHREKKPCQFSIPIGQTHTRGRGEREKGEKGESRQTTTIVGPFLFLLANIHSNCGYSHTRTHAKHMPQIGQKGTSRRHSKVSSLSRLPRFHFLLLLFLVRIKMHLLTSNLSGNGRYLLIAVMKSVRPNKKGWIFDEIANRNRLKTLQRVKRTTLGYCMLMDLGLGSQRKAKVSRALGWLYMVSQTRTYN